MITDRHNYDDGYISLVNLDLANLPKTILVEGESFCRKTEFHISIICAKRIAPIINQGNAVKVEAEIVQHFIEFTKEIPLTEFRLLPEIRMVQRDERKTVVIMAELVGISEWFETLRRIYGKDIPTQPGHITLYALQPEKGIGLLSKQQVDEYSRIIALPKLLEELDVA